MGQPSGVKSWRFFFFALAAVLVAFAWRAEYNHDEIEHLHATWLLSVGQRPFTDFLEQHHPTLWIVFQPLAAHLRSPQLLVFAARLYDIFVLGALLVTLHRLVRLLHPEAAPWTTLLVLGSYIFVHNMMLFRPDPTMNALFYGGLLNWAVFLQERRIWRAAAAGLLFGLAIAVLQKAFAVCGLVALATAGLLVVHREERRRTLLLGAGAALVAALLPLGALAAWVAAKGLWHDFWFWNYEFNRFFYTRATLSVQFGIRQKLLRSIGEDAALWLFGIAGAVAWLRRRRSWDAGDDIRLTLLVTLVGYLLLLTFNKFPFEQYFIVFLPLFAPFAAELLGWRPRWLAVAVRCACVAVLAITLGQFVALRDNLPQRRIQEAILRLSTPEQTIYASPPHHPIFRLDASYFWYNGALIGQACAAYEKAHPGVIDGRLLDDAKWQPAVVYLDPDFPSYWPYLWARRAGEFRASDEPDLWMR
jgi:hypothetical protein